MPTKDKLVKVSSLEETAKTIQANFPTVSGGGVSSSSLIAVNIVDVDTLTDTVGLITFSAEIIREINTNDQIVFKYDDSLYFCNIYSITSQELIDNVRYVVAIIKVIIVNHYLHNDNMNDIDQILLPINQNTANIQRGVFKNAGSGWNTFTFPLPFFDVPIVTANVKGASTSINYSILLTNINKYSFQYCLKNIASNANVSDASEIYWIAMEAN